MAAGIPTVAVYSEADRHAAHVRMAQQAFCIGPPAAKESYLQKTRVLEVHTHEHSVLPECAVLQALFGVQYVYVQQRIQQQASTCLLTSQDADRSDESLYRWSLSGLQQPEKAVTCSKGNLGHHACRPHQLLLLAPDRPTVK